MDLSIIIVNYNVKHFLEQAILSVEKAIQGITCEVFVVDNNSVDGSTQLVKEKFPWVLLIENKKNVGFSVANNQAIKLAKGKYILLLNPDTIVEEDTFKKVLDFMESHSDAGGLGVKMLDGTGHFLPESKRSLPTPWVSFYKIFGFSKIFPKSKKFGKYHLTYLNKDENHEVEILAGAFMLLRKSVLDQIGLLDEDYFMYGEDIDLSYRIIKSGYKNYYYSGTQIIHYKGESTKKGSMNYVKVFYNAMLIFARKHFSKGNIAFFTFLIQIAVYFRAIIAISNRIINKLFFPFYESLSIYLAIYGIKDYWEKNHRYVEGGHYPLSFDVIAAPTYTFVFVLFLTISGAYSKPYNTKKIILAALWGFITIATVSFLFPAINYSRAIVGLASIFTVFIAIFNRILFTFVKTKKFSFTDEVQKKRIIIVADNYEALRVINLIKKELAYQCHFVGLVAVSSKQREEGFEILGTIDQLDEIVDYYRVEEVIFCNKSITSGEIISIMGNLFRDNLDYKIIPKDTDFIIGPKEIHATGGLYGFTLNDKTRITEHIIAKRFFDFAFALLLVLVFPVTFWLYKHPFKAFFNLFEVLFGNYHLVGYINNNNQGLPQLKKGLLNMKHLLVKKGKKDVIYDDFTKLDAHYAKSHTIQLDLIILLRGIQLIGGK
jgi:glycosyltransferase involved in cell wall biosynthesis